MSIFQLIAVLFAAFMIYVVRVKNRRYKLSAIESFGWYAHWVAFMVLALFPNILSGVTQAISFSRVFDLLVVGSFMVLSTLVVFSHFKIKELDQKLEKYVRDEAINA